MRDFLRNISLSFTAGTFGGLLNSIALWFMGYQGFTRALNVSIAPTITPEWLYPRLVWGGIWGLLFSMQIMRGSIFVKGAIYSLGPTLVQLFVVFPMKSQQGMMGVKLGTLTPVVVVIANLVWGLGAAAWLKSACSVK